MKIFAFLSSIGGGGTEITVVDNYTALLALPPIADTFYWCQNSQGTAWLPGSLGGTYYPKGIYYCLTTSPLVIQYIETPYQATQAEVDTGTIEDKFVSPKTFNDSSQLTASALKTKLGIGSWVDYSATSTVVGWTAFTEKIIAYKMLDDETMVVFVRITGTGNSGVSVPSVTLPMHGAMFGAVAQYGTTGTGGDNGVSVITSHLIEDSSHELKFYKRSTTGAVTGFTGAGSRFVYMQVTLKVGV